jgi:hypothetical protein
MASGLARLAGQRVGSLLLPVLKTKSNAFVIPVRTKVCTETGAMLEKPEKTRFGLLKVALVVVPFVTAGGMLSAEFASLMEETGFFVYEEDDD